eukprot:PITA_09672
MAQSNVQALDLNLIIAMSDENEEGSSIQVSEMFDLSPWYSYIIYVLKNLSPPPDMTRNKERKLKLKIAKFCILNSALYWKDPSGILLNFLVEKEAKKVMEDFHGGECGGHLFWKSTANKILRAGYYWPTLFADVYKMVKSCHKFQIFEGRQKLHPLPLKPIEVSAPFQQWELDFIGEIHPTSSSQHRWILTATDYFTKWIEAIPTRQATNARRLNQMVHLQQTREEVFQNTSKLQEKIKKIYDRKAKAKKFQLDDVVLKWDARNEEKGKHGKFENLWKGPFKITIYWGQNAFLLKEMNGEDCLGGPINGRLLKRYHS